MRGLVFVLVVALVAVCHSAVYFVDSAADSGGDGSEATPYIELLSALNAATGADEIRIKDSGDVYHWSASGAKSLTDVDGTFKIVGISNTPAKISVSSSQMLTTTLTSSSPTFTLKLENLEIAPGAYPSSTDKAFILCGGSTSYNYSVELKNLTFDMSSTSDDGTTGEALLKFRFVSDVTVTNVTFKDIGDFPVDHIFHVFSGKASSAATFTNTKFLSHEGGINVAGSLIFLDQFDDVITTGVKVVGSPTDSRTKDFIYNVIDVERLQSTATITEVTIDAMEEINTVVLLGDVDVGTEVEVSDVNLHFDHDLYSAVVVYAGSTNSPSVPDRRRAPVESKLLRVTNISVDVDSGLLGEVSVLTTGSSSEYKVKTVEVEDIHHAGATSRAVSTSPFPEAVFGIDALVTGSVSVSNVTFAGVENTDAPTVNQRNLFQVQDAAAGSTVSFTDVLVKGNLEFVALFLVENDATTTIDGVKMENGTAVGVVEMYAGSATIRNFEVVDLKVTGNFFMVEEGSVVLEDNILINSLEFTYETRKDRRDTVEKGGIIATVNSSTASLTTSGDHKIKLGVDVVDAVKDSEYPPFVSTGGGDVTVKVELVGCPEPEDKPHGVDAFCGILSSELRRVPRESSCEASVTDSRTCKADDIAGDGDLSPSATTSTTCVFVVATAAALVGALL